MALNIPPQNTFLYKSNWSHALDESLLETIIRLKHEHDMAGTVVPKPFFDIAAADMAYDLGVTMPWEALYDRLQFLESRYLSFKALVKEDGVKWDEPNNIVVATDDTWKTILKKLPNRFVAELEQPLPANCRIENEFGCVASVVSETRGDVHQFARGWFQCARNNALRHGDLLIFKYEGNGLFTMQRYWAGTRFPPLLHAEAMEFEPSYEENDGNSARACASAALTTGSYNYLY